VAGLTGSRQVVVVVVWVVVVVVALPCAHSSRT